MEESARRYARKVLLIHLLLLAVIVLLVLVAGKEIYTRTREQAIEQALRRQALLANQTARGIESFYGGILNDLDLLQRSDAETATQPATRPTPNRGFRGFLFARPLWKQLESRVTHLFVYDKQAKNPIVFEQHGDSTIELPDITTRMKPWLDSIDAKAISGFQMFGEQGVNVVCMPIDPENRRILAAVVPVKQVEELFFARLNDDPHLGITLVDDKHLAMATSNRQLVGADLLKAADASMQSEIVQRSKQGRPFTWQIDQPQQVQGVQLKPALLAFDPINLPGGKRWWVYAALPIAEIDATLGRVFERAVMWAAFVIVSMTGILVSTSIQMIRSRVRIERIRHEALRKELDQARRIQLAWLPESQPMNAPIDIAAVNQPASHISGDFYNWFELDDGRVVVTIGDVTGHGMSAAFLMATTQMLVRTTMTRLRDPGRCLADINNQLCQQVFNGQFVTMLILLVDAKAQSMQLATAGHPAPLLSPGDDEAFTPMPADPQLVLGVERDIDYLTEHHPLTHGSRLILYTDGVVDVQNPTGDRLKLPGLQQIAPPAQSAADLLHRVVQSITQFRAARELGDDLTLVTVRVAKPA